MTIATKLPRHWAPHIPLKHPDHLTAAARHMLGIISTSWQWKSSERVNVGGNESGGFIVVGSETRPLMSGPNKGKPTWIGEERRVVITRTDLDEQYIRFEKSTGDCHACYGIALRPIGAGPKGVHYEGCARCGMTGKAP